MLEAESQVISIWHTPIAGNGDCASS